MLSSLLLVPLLLFYPLLHVQEIFPSTISKDEASENETIWIKPATATKFVGESVKFTCLTNTPFSSHDFSWYKYGGKGQISRDAIIDKNILSIANTSFNDYGKYRCSINNLTISAYSELLSPDQDGISVEYYIEPHDVYLIDHLGQQVILRCKCEANVYCKTTWTSEAKNQNFSQSEGVLVIDNVTSEHIGPYACFSKPPASYELSINIEMKPSSE